MVDSVEVAGARGAFVEGGGGAVGVVESYSSIISSVQNPQLQCIVMGLEKMEDIPKNELREELCL